MSKFILIGEARAAGLGIGGGKQVRACACASELAAEYALERELQLGGYGRAVVAYVNAAFWEQVLAGKAEEAVLAELLNTLHPVFSPAEAIAA